MTVLRDEDVPPWDGVSPKLGGCGAAEAAAGPTEDAAGEEEGGGA